MAVFVILVDGWRDMDVQYAMGAATVADADIEIAVRTKGQAAAIVLAVDPVQLHQHPFRCGIGAVRMLPVDTKFRGPPGVSSLALER